MEDVGVRIEEGRCKVFSNEGGGWKDFLCISARLGHTDTPCTPSRNPINECFSAAVPPSVAVCFLPALHLYWRGDSVGVGSEKLIPDPGDPCH